MIMIMEIIVKIMNLIDFLPWQAAQMLGVGGVKLKHLSIINVKGVWHIGQVCKRGTRMKLTCEAPPTVF